MDNTNYTSGLKNILSFVTSGYKWYLCGTAHTATHYTVTKLGTASDCSYLNIVTKFTV